MVGIPARRDVGREQFEPGVLLALLNSVKNCEDRPDIEYAGVFKDAPGRTPAGNRRESMSENDTKHRRSLIESAMDRIAHAAPGGAATDRVAYAAPGGAAMDCVAHAAPDGASSTVSREPQLGRRDYDQALLRRNAQPGTASHDEDQAALARLPAENPPVVGQACSYLRSWNLATYLCCLGARCGRLGVAGDRRCRSRWRRGTDAAGRRYPLRRTRSDRRVAPGGGSRPCARSFADGCRRAAGSRSARTLAAGVDQPRCRCLPGLLQPGFPAGGWSDTHRLGGRATEEAVESIGHQRASS